MTTKIKFKSIIESTILRKHRHKMGDYEHYHRNRVIEGCSVEEFGVKWSNGDIGLRINLKENLVKIWARIGKYSDSLNIDFYDEDDFIELNNKLIKEMIRGVESEYYLNSNYEV